MMKAKITILIALLFVCMGSAAQEQKNGITLGWSYYPTGLSKLMSGPVTSSSNPSQRSDFLEGYLPANTVGLFALEYDRMIGKKRTFSARVSAVSWDREENPLFWLNVMVSIRYNYVQKETWMLYSGAGFGCAISLVENESNRIIPGFQIIPIGVSFGRRLYGFLNLGLGLEYNGFSAGLGYRF